MALALERPSMYPAFTCAAWAFDLITAAPFGLEGQAAVYLYASISEYCFPWFHIIDTPVASWMARQSPSDLVGYAARRGTTIATPMIR